MDKLRKFLTAKKENGSSELPTTLILLPLSIFLLFALIDVSFYMVTRAQVQNILHDGVRQVALYGGNDASAPLNNTGKNVNQLVLDRLWNSDTKQCRVSSCSAPPVVTCGTATGQVALTVGEEVFCKVTYSYKPVANDFFFGFTTNVTKPAYTLESFSVAETGING